MTRALNHRMLLPFAALLVATLAACASPVAPGGAPPSGIAADGEVLGQGTVLQIGDAAPQFCLGAMADSYPPQCTGPEIVGWDWADVQGSEASGDVTWGSYAVQGTWDGTRFTVTAPPILLALYDPIRVVDPKRDPANPGTTSEQKLHTIQDELSAIPLGTNSLQPLMTWIENGYLFVTYIYDDGDIQRYLENKYGADVVLVRPALRLIGN